MSSVLAALRPPRLPAAVFLSLQGRGAAVPPPGDRGTAPCPHGLGEQPEVPQVQPGLAAGTAEAVLGSLGAWGSGGRVRRERKFLRDGKGRHCPRGP